MLLCDKCEHLRVIGGTQICDIDDIPFAGFIEQATELDSCPFFDACEDEEGDDGDDAECD